MADHDYPEPGATHYKNGAPIVCPTCKSDDCFATEAPGNPCVDGSLRSLRERVAKLYEEEPVMPVTPYTKQEVLRRWVKERHPGYEIPANAKISLVFEMCCDAGHHTEHHFYVKVGRKTLAGFDAYQINEFLSALLQEEA